MGRGGARIIVRREWGATNKQGPRQTDASGAGTSHINTVKRSACGPYTIIKELSKVGWVVVHALNDGAGAVGALNMLSKRALWEGYRLRCGEVGATVATGAVSP